MNKAELVEAIASATQLSKAQAEASLKATIDIISGQIAKGNSVALIGFGTFGVSKRAARKGKNPRTGEAIKIAARKVPKFSPGAGLKAVANGEKKVAAAAKKAAPAKKAAAPAKKKK
ncbi:MAG: HU family DNA-binding protein [Candidatus Kapabacteria bacterium]|nr:HU family DNA-binding protein [Candidatus Kapabacteria bacterium]